MPMRDFFAGITGHWPAGVEHYHWHVLPDPEIIRRQLAGPYQELTHRTGLASVQSRWSHITVQHFAPLGRPADDAMGKIIELVRDRCSRIAPFQAVIGKAQVQAAGIVCPVRAGPSLRQLWQAATGAGRNVTGKRYEVRPDPYDPHLTLAYACADVNDKPLQEWLSSRRIGTVAIPVTRLSLVAQRHDCKEITWRLLEHIPLSGKPR
jgi:2'-5' RNA ligase